VINTKYSKEFISTLEGHITAKYINNFWLYPTLLGEEEDIGKLFPYYPCGSVREMEDCETVVSSKQKSFKNSLKDKKIFLLNIPMRHLPDYELKSFKNLESFLEKLKNESFGINAEESGKIAEQRLFIVIGINQISSIDIRVNETFKNFIKRIPPFDGLTYKIESFFWKPEWTSNVEFLLLDKVREFNKRKDPKKEFVFTKEKAFLIVRYLNDRRSRFLRKRLEGDSLGLSKYMRNQIPYQKIREHIKNSNSTKEYFQIMHEKYPSSLKYFMTMDDDVESLRVGEDKKGYFEVLTHAIDRIFELNKFYPSVISLGYYLSSINPIISVKAVEIDMAVRAKMNWCIPGSAYFPEPGTGYQMIEVNFLEKFSFLASKRSQDQNIYESRRAIENGIKNGIINKGRMVFLDWKGFFTKMPKGFEPSIYLDQNRLLKRYFFEKKTFQALRNIKYVHFEPFNWGAAILEALPEELKNGTGINGITGKIKGICARIFKIFDPISMMMKMDYGGRDFSLIYREVMENYLENSKDIIALAPSKYCSVWGERISLMKEKYNLKKLNFSEYLIGNIVRTAFESGKAIYYHIS
jgi:hypothetical protein